MQAWMEGLKDSKNRKCDILENIDTVYRKVSILSTHFLSD